MRKPYFQIIDDCIDQFRLDEKRTFNFALVDFADTVFHNYGHKPVLSQQEVYLLLSHAQEFVSSAGRDNVTVRKLGEFISHSLRVLPRPETKAEAIYEIIFEDRPASDAATVTSDDIARFISLLPLKQYWDNSGVIYRRACCDEQTFSNVFLYQYRYDAPGRRPADIQCREIIIPQHCSDPNEVRGRVDGLMQQNYQINSDYFGLQPYDRDLYNLYGQLYDLLNWGASNPQGVINYVEARAREFSFLNCVFPLVLHGIYYGVAYFDLPSEYFASQQGATECFSRFLDKGWTYVTHYFPSIIMDAYNSRMIDRFTRNSSSATLDIVNVVSSKVPLHSCYDARTGQLFYFQPPSDEIRKELTHEDLALGLKGNTPEFAEAIGRVDSSIHPKNLISIPQQIFDQELYFNFNLPLLPGREKCIPILESHLAQAAFVLETLQFRHEREVFEERSRILDMLAHDEKTTQELLISDLEEGLPSDLAALQLREQSHKEKIMRNHMLSRSAFFRDAEEAHELRPGNLQDMFVQLFCKVWRVWLKSTRFRESFRRNRQPSFALTSETPREVVEQFLSKYFSPETTCRMQACLALLRDTFEEFSGHSDIEIIAPPLLLTEFTRVRIETVLYNLLCNYFKHAAVSRLTGKNECSLRLVAEPAQNHVDFKFSFSNSTLIKERFSEDLAALTLPGHQVNGLQIVRYLIESEPGEKPPYLSILHENYVWQIEIVRECRGCRQIPMVNPHS